MGMFDSFLGNNGGYTPAQRTGLRRSSQIKKKRKEEERAFTREQEVTKNKAALTERRMIEAGQTRRTGMAEAGQTRRTGMTTAAGIQKQKLSDVGQMARQRLTGEQNREAATTKATREANVKSIEQGRLLTRGEIGHGYDIELQKVRNKGAKNNLRTLFDESQGSAALGALPSNTTEGEPLGGQKEYTFAQYTGLGQKEQMGYATYLKNNNRKKFKEFAGQYKMLYSPKPEGSVVPESETYGPNISQSPDLGISQYSDKTYRNY